MNPSLIDLEARVSTVAEFLKMLRHIHQKSGRTANHIAEIANIPRSTAYRYVSLQNKALPTNRDHLERFLRVCKLQPRDIKRVMRVWDQLVPTRTPELLLSQKDSTPPAPSIRGPQFRPDPISRARAGSRHHGRGHVREFGVDYSIEERQQVRQVLLDAGLDENDLLERLVNELLLRGYRPRRAWRLANELTQQRVAEEYNLQISRTNSYRSGGMQAARISDFEAWPFPRRSGRDLPRPTITALKTLAAIYCTTWDRLVDTHDLRCMPDKDIALWSKAVKLPGSYLW